MKKLLTILLTLLLTVALTCALAETVYTSGDYRYILLADGTAEITDYTGKAEELMIPAELNGHRVAAIGNSAFFRCTSLTSITLPDGVTSIGANPFTGCYKLTDISVSPDHPTLATIAGVLFEKTEKRLVCYPCAFTVESYTIPQGIKVIGDWAFCYCDSLTSITIPDSVTSIGDSAFSSCDSLTSIAIPDSVTSIGDSAFSLCFDLTSITLPDSVTSIGDSAFHMCDSLTSITIPDSVTTIGVNPFTGCDKLARISVSPDHPTLATIDSVLLEKTEKRLICYPCAFTAKSYTIPQGIQVIGDEAFYYCDSLTSITIPDSVTSIEDRAFYYCRSLTSITLPDSVTSISFGVFIGCPSTLTLTVGRDSYAMQYAIDNDLNYTYPDSLDWLLN